MTRRVLLLLEEGHVMRRRWWVVVSLFAGLSLPAQATNGMRMTGFGPVQNAMGGTGVGATLDAASIVSNPAGMTEIGGRIDFGGSYFRPSVEYKANSIAPGSGLVLREGETLQSDRGASPIPVLGVTLPLSDHWFFGIGAYGVAGMGVDYGANLYGSTTYSSYSQMRFAPAFAYRFNDMFSLGVTANIMFGTTSWNVASAFGQAPHMGADAFGIGATVGLKFTPFKALTFGVAYESKAFFADYRYNITGRLNPLDPTGSPLPGGVDKLTFDQPQLVTVGAAVRPLDALLLAADVEWINWSQVMGAGKPAYSQNQSQAMPWNLNWKDQWVFKVGVEVTATSFLKLRAGWNYGKNPLDPSRAFENIAFPAIAEHHLMAGLGIELGENFTVNLGGMYAPKTSLSGNNPNPPPGTPGYSGPFGQGIASYTTSMSQWGLDIGISHRH
jgi:long-chain fatty acid transport protein